jgi:predicted ATP-grasp superfamily ATP-dependent carboligase
MVIDLLLIEELLASESLWLQSPPSLRAEATAMVAALIHDLAHIPGLQSAVLLSPTAAAGFRQQQLLPPQVLTVISEHGAAEWLQHPSLPPETIRQLLILAPEFSSLLVDRLTAAESPPWRQTQVLNLPSRMAAVFSDKFATEHWLRQHALATPQTWLLSRSERNLLLQSSRLAQNHNPRSARFVLKPRCGAGCDQVTLLRLSKNIRQQLQNTPDRTGLTAESDWILQRRVQGRACSVSLLGQGTLGPTIILPPGLQRITKSTNGRLHYRGGQIPCDPAAATLITDVAQHFADALGPFRGWLGVDIVVSTNSQHPSAQIIEVNPRLCTSFIGYRQLARENLALRLLLLTDPSTPVQWLTGTVCFKADGDTTEDLRVQS